MQRAQSSRVSFGVFIYNGFCCNKDTIFWLNWGAVGLIIVYRDENLRLGFGYFLLPL